MRRPQCAYACQKAASGGGVCVRNGYMRTRIASASTSLRRERPRECKKGEGRGRKRGERSQKGTGEYD
eukprot:3181538-Pleurochrysis_carterae.AAC.2